VLQQGHCPPSPAHCCYGGIIERPGALNGSLRGEFRVCGQNSRSFVYAKLCSDTARRAERARQHHPLVHRKHRDLSTAPCNNVQEMKDRGEMRRGSQDLAKATIINT